MTNDDRLQPYAANPRYWQYKQRPVMLLGGSQTDHIFLLDGLESHLDEIQATGGNYVRNTMSQREGAHLKPHRMLPDGTFDLDQWNYDEAHWDCLQWLLQQVNRHPRPSNHTKIYGSGYYAFGTGGPEDGVERFWRNILGGSAGARFHRPDAGNGLNDFAKASLRAARLLEERIHFWDVTPHMDLLSDCSPNEAYLAAAAPERYALYFTDGGSVTLDLTSAPGPFEVTWISVSMGIIVETAQVLGYRKMENLILGGRPVQLVAPYKGGWVAALVREPD